MLPPILLTLGEVSWTLRPSFAALAQLEADSGTGLLALARRFAAGECTLRDIEALVRAGMAGGGQTPPPDLGEQLLAAGLSSLTPVLGRFLRAALGAGDDPAGKASAANG